MFPWYRNQSAGFYMMGTVVKRLKGEIRGEYNIRRVNYVKV